MLAYMRRPLRRNSSSSFVSQGFRICVGLNVSAQMGKNCLYLLSKQMILLNKPGFLLDPAWKLFESSAQSQDMDLFRCLHAVFLKMKDVKNHIQG